MEADRDLAEQLLAAIDKRYKRERIAWVCLLIVSLLISAYFASKSSGDIAPVSMSQQQAETVPGVQKVAELTHTFILPRQSAEVAAQIKEAEKKPPAQVITVKDGITEEAVKTAQDRKADFTIVTPADTGKGQLNVYNIKAYPQSLIEFGVGSRGREIAYLTRINAPRIPLLLPKGGVGYLGPYLRKDTGNSKVDFGVKVLIPLN